MFSVPILAILAALVSTAMAGPPAPYFVIQGIVRDQVGQRLSNNGTSYVILLNQGIEIKKAPITGALVDQNYELNISVDANRPGTVLYRDSALPANAPLEIAIELNGTRYYPIEVAGNLNIGQGGEKIQLDLTLGVDSDGDGLPDTWEEWQLYQAGHLPGEDGNWDLSLISRDGDFDGDGQKDGLEYIAGTFAGDATETFQLKIDKVENTQAQFSFYQIIGKTYTLERSSDGINWQRVNFRPAATSAAAQAYTAKTSGITAAESPSSENIALYRLTVR